MTKMKDISKNLCSVECSIRDVMESLNKGVNGIIFLHDNNGVVKGLMTDGDVRRAILKGAPLEDKVRKYMNTDFIYALEGLPRNEYLKKIQGKILQLPILNEEGHLVDILFFKENAFLPVSSPSLCGNELKYITDCVLSSWISSQGAYVKKFEKKFSEYHYDYPALSTSSGTAALHLALVASGIGPGDEVIVPDSTFAASANVVIHAGARPVFVDISEDHWTLNPELLQKAITPRTKAIMPVHLYGQPACMDEIMSIAEEHNLLVIEDCAESLGARYKGRLTGTIGHIGCFSFFSNKVITTGEGGMVITKRKDILQRVSQLRDHGMSLTERYRHEYVGFNYRLTGMQAAVGLAQMEQIDSFLSHRQKIVMEYESGLKDIPGITLPPRQEETDSIFWLYTILIDEIKFGMTRDTLMSHLKNARIDSRPFFPPLHGQPAYKTLAVEGVFPVAIKLHEVGLSLPTANNLSLERIKSVCSYIKKLQQGRSVDE